MQHITNIHALKAQSTTQQFATEDSMVYRTNLDVIPAIGSVLNWSPLAMAFLGHVVRQLDDEQSELVIIKHADFARAIFPNITAVSGLKKMCRCIKALKADQEASGFQAVHITSGKASKGTDGTLKYFPTSYRMGDFFEVFRQIQEAVAERDTLAIANDNIRRRKFKDIVAEICADLGFRPVPTPEPVASSEPAPAKVIDIGERLTQRDVEQRISDAFESLSAAGIDWLKLGKSLPEYVKKMHALAIDVEIRLRDARKVQVRRLKNGKIKLNGVQPK